LQSPKTKVPMKAPAIIPRTKLIILRPPPTIAVRRSKSSSPGNSPTRRHSSRHTWPNFDPGSFRGGLRALPLPWFDRRDVSGGATRHLVRHNDTGNRSRRSWGFLGPLSDFRRSTGALALAHVYGQPPNAIAISDKRLTNAEAIYTAPYRGGWPAMHKNRRKGNTRRRSCASALMAI
jgi:hypothetical protein